MAALFDINEYRHCVKQFQIPLLARLFSMMYALMDLCIVRPENLKEVCSSEQFVSVTTYYFLDGLMFMAASLCKFLGF